MNPENIIISRTDSIGDVVLTLPMAKIIKDHFPGCRVAFLAREYTKPAINACSYVDQFISLNDFMRKEPLIGKTRAQAIIHVLPQKAVAKRAKELGIPMRIGTTSRLFHLTTCNKLVRLSRKNSDLHEAQLNLKLLAPLGITENFDLKKLQDDFGLERIQPLGPSFSKLLDPTKYNLILHPKSQGNGREWGLNNYLSLINMLDPGRFKIFVSGTEAEQPMLQSLFDQANDRVTNLIGQMDLYQFMAFIKRADGLVASGTGPLHLAAALGKDAFGIFPPVRPIHPGRWAPLGDRVKVFVSAESCKKCLSKTPNCDCMSAVQPVDVLTELENRFNLKTSLS